MNKLDTRFAGKEVSNIEEKYVLYVEDLHVSFKSNPLRFQIKEKIKQKKKQYKLSKKFSSQEGLSKIKEDIFKLKRQLKDIDLKNEIKILEDQLKTSDHESKKDLQSEIKTLKESMVKNNKGKKHVLKGITLGLRQGETLALVGANGAGKTVLLETILGFNIPDSYKKMVLNLGHKKYSDNIQEIGIQYQQSKMPTNYKVREAINNQIRIFKKRINKAEVEEMIEEFGILEFIESSVESLSGGQKQRLNLLLAVIHQPKIMILDEFITGLDVNSVRRIITYVNKLKVQNNASMIIVSHQPEEIEALADRIVTMKNGVVTSQTNVPDVISEYGTMARFVEEVI